jgi:hypothetical protein
MEFVRFSEAITRNVFLYLVGAGDNNHIFVDITTEPARTANPDKLIL